MKVNVYLKTYLHRLILPFTDTLTQNLTKGMWGILKVLTGKMRFFERPSPMSHFAFFFSNFPPLFCIYAAYQILLKEAEKARNCNFNLKLQSLLHVNTQLLTNYVDKIWN